MIKQGKLARLWSVLALTATLVRQTRGVRIGKGRWLAIVGQYQANTGGRASLADADGSYSQRIAASAQRSGAVYSILVAAIGSFGFMLTAMWGDAKPRKFR